jgi:hypothetical protein
MLTLYEVGDRVAAGEFAGAQIIGFSEWWIG